MQKICLAVTHPSTNIILYCLTSLIDISLHSVTYPLCFDTNLDIFSYTYTTGSKLSISTLGLDRDLGFSRGHQGHQPHDDDDDEKEEDDETENNVKDDDNIKDENNETGMMITRRRTRRWRTTTRKTTITRLSQLWN